jgi:hypothetical protein
MIAMHVLMALFAIVNADKYFYQQLYLKDSQIYAIPEIGSP